MLDINGNSQNVEAKIKTTNGLVAHTNFNVDETTTGLYNHIQKNNQNL